MTDPDVNYGTLGWYDPQQGGSGILPKTIRTPWSGLTGIYLVQEAAGQNDQLLPIVVSPPVSPPPVSPPVTSSTSTVTTLSAGRISYRGSYATETLRVTVKPISGTAKPGGTVTLVYNGQVLATATLQVVNGVETASFNIVYHANGSYPFTVQYAGNSQFQGSSSSVTVVV